MVLLVIDLFNEFNCFLSVLSQALLDIAQSLVGRVDLFLNNRLRHSVNLQLRTRAGAWFASKAWPGPLRSSAWLSAPSRLHSQAAPRTRSRCWPWWSRSRGRWGMVAGPLPSSGLCSDGLWTCSYLRYFFHLITCRGWHLQISRTVSWFCGIRSYAW